VSGWELRKALRLLRKSNPPLLEWLKSPIVYQHDPVFAAEFGALAAEFYSPRRCFAHYLHMAHGNWRDYLRGRDEVSLKKYLYVFRPLLACRWIERQLGQVPMLFASSWRACSKKPTSAQRSTNSLGESRPATSWP
jgi:predicted nucleotidyltransferase